MSTIIGQPAPPFQLPSTQIERSIFLTDTTGILRQEWRKVTVKEHALSILTAVQHL